jgi:hypothetical protein
MASDFRAKCRMVPATAALVLSLVSIAATPAFAVDDGQQDFFSAVLGLVGVNLGGNTDAGPIDYHERAPLVLPPKTELTQPLPPVTARNQAWPQDPDVLKAKQAAELAKAPRVTPDSDHDAAISAEESRRRGTPDPNASVPTGDCLDNHTCDPNTFWSLLKNTKKEDTEKAELSPGQEPPREYLTQPPPGYLAMTKVVKATGEAPKDPGDADPNDNSAAYFRNLKESQSSPNVQ